MDSERLAKRQEAMRLRMNRYHYRKLPLPAPRYVQINAELLQALIDLVPENDEPFYECEIARKILAEHD